jgi:hypothetical protein
LGRCFGRRLLRWCRFAFRRSEVRVRQLIEAERRTQILRRIAEVEAGSAKLVPADEVFAEVRQLLR